MVTVEAKCQWILLCSTRMGKEWTEVLSYNPCYNPHNHPHNQPPRSQGTTTNMLEQFLTWVPQPIVSVDIQHMFQNDPQHHLLAQDDSCWQCICDNLPCYQKIKGGKSKPRCQTCKLMECSLHPTTMESLDANIRYLSIITSLLGCLETLKENNPMEVSIGMRVGMISSLEELVQLMRRSGGKWKEVRNRLAVYK